MPRGYRASTTPAEERQVLETPVEIVSWLKHTFNFTVDLAASDANGVVEKYFSEHGEGEGSLGDALTTPWGIDGDTVGFCNPPYFNLHPWVNKAYQEALRGFTSVFLIPSFNGETWGRFAFRNAAQVILINGRLSFISPVTGQPKPGNNRGSMVVVFAPYLRSGDWPPVSMVDRDQIFHDYSVVGFPVGLLERARALTEGIDVDLNQPL